DLMRTGEWFIVATSARLPRFVRTGVAFVASACATVLLVLPGTAAHATPSPAQIEAQINALWNQSETAIEQYNAVHSKLQANQAKLAQLKKQMDPLQLQVQLAYTQVGAMSAELYMRGPGSSANALLTAGSPANFADQLTTLDQLARVQHDAISN